MSDTANANEELFDGGPLLRWERSFGRVKAGRPPAARRTLIALLIAWVPMAVLATAQLLIWGDESAKSFFSDIAVHARFLVAVPALLFAEAECIPRLGRIVNHFRDTGLVVEADKARFREAVSSTRRLFDGTPGEVVTVVLAYLVVAAMAIYLAPEAMAWHRPGATGVWRFSPAGWWHVLVSLPLFLLLFLGWIWRVLLWTRFLFLMSRLDLRLIPGHPDRAGGLMFVSLSLRGFRLVSFALGAVVAGSIANRMMLQGTQPLDFKNLVIGLLVFLLILFAGPLVIFLKKLRETERRGYLEYGALARAVGTQFEAKWLRLDAEVAEKSLEAPDFSATTDLYSITANVYALRTVPFTLRDLIGPIGISAMLPFIPLLLLAMPLDVILRGLVKLLF